MKSFKSYISEEVLPTAQVENGNFDIENDAVRGQINVTLASVTAQAAVTPYILLRKVSKALAYFHIILPKRTFLEGNKGIEVYEVMQYGHKMGMNDQGEFINEVPAKFFLFFQYGVVHPFNVTYTKPNIDGMFRGVAKIVDKVELDRLLNAAEAMMAESCAYDDKATESERHAGREEIPPQSPSTKKAVKDSAKGEKPEDVNEATDKDRDLSKLASSAMSKGHPVKKLPSGRAQNAVLPKTMAKGLNLEKGRWSGHGSFNEEQIDELKKSTLRDYIIASAKRMSDDSFDHGEDEHRQYGDRGEDPDRDREVDDRERKISNRKKGIGRAADKLAKEEYEKVEAGVKKRPGETHTLHRRNPGHKTEYHTITTERDGRKTVKTGSPKYIKKHWDKMEEQIDEASYDKLDKYVRNAHVSGTGAAARGEIAMHRGQKTRLHRANKTGEKREQGINLALDKMAGRALVPATRKEKMKEEYGVFRKGGSIGEKPSTEPHKTFDNVTDAKLHAKGMNKQLSPGEKKYYRIKYHVKPLQKEETLDEKLTKRMSAGDVISDFIHSDDPKFKGKSKKERQKMALGAYYGMHPEKSKNMEEGLTPVKKSYGMRRMKRKVSTQVKQGLGIGKEKTNTVLVTNKDDPHARAGGGVHRIPRDKYDPKKHNLASE